MTEKRLVSARIGRGRNKKRPPVVEARDLPNQKQRKAIYMYNIGAVTALARWR
jgi:hypothetical protein